MRRIVLTKQCDDRVRVKFKEDLVDDLESEHLSCAPGQGVLEERIEYVMHEKDMFRALRLRWFQNFRGYEESIVLDVVARSPNFTEERLQSVDQTGAGRAVPFDLGGLEEADSL